MAPLDAPSADDLARGVTRLLFRAGLVAQREVPLGNGRRVDLFALCAHGRITVVEIKVALSDLRGDAKWREYLPYCDRFFWAVPPWFPHECFGTEAFGFGRAGLIVADRHDAVIVNEAAEVVVAGARRRAEMLRFARRAGARLVALSDPELVSDELTV